MGSLVSMLALSLRNGCLVLVEGEEVSDKMREEFEAWAITSAWLGLVGEDLEFDAGYVSCEVQSAWLSWQASRQVIMVELPDYTSHFYGGDHFDECQYAADCEKAIESLGLKVKP